MHWLVWETSSQSPFAWTQLGREAACCPHASVVGTAKLLMGLREGTGPEVRVCTLADHQVWVSHGTEVQG